MNKNLFCEKIFIKNWGTAAVIITESGLFRVLLPRKNDDDIKNVIENLSERYDICENNSACAEYSKFIRDYFAGSNPSNTLKIDMSEMTPFQKQVYKTCRQIPYGQVRSYWWIAVRIGNPYAMRSVGGAMAANPCPIVIPCHRVVRADNTLGGFSGGLDLKLSLLKHEGVDIDSFK